MHSIELFDRCKISICFSQVFVKFVAMNYTFTEPPISLNAGRQRGIGTYKVSMLKFNALDLAELVVSKRKQSLLLSVRSNGPLISNFSSTVLRLYPPDFPWLQTLGCVLLLWLKAWRVFSHTESRTAIAISINQKGADSWLTPRKWALFKVRISIWLRFS